MKQDENKKRKRKERGQNKRREKIHVKENNALCPAISIGNECPYKENCKFPHDVEAYLATKAPDIGDKCPIFERYGVCPAGFKCRWLAGHVVINADGKYELVKKPDGKFTLFTVNTVGKEVQRKLRTKQLDLSKAESIISAVLGEEKPDPSSKVSNIPEENRDANSAISEGKETDSVSLEENGVLKNQTVSVNVDLKEISSQARSNIALPTLRPQEKNLIDWRDRKILAPLTTVGNPPFRRLCGSLGADTFYSEMAMCYPLMQGHQPEWALVRGLNYEREMMRGGRRGILGVQLATGKLWQATKTAQVIAEQCDGVDFLDLNCGCPIDLVFRQGAGSSLLENPGRLLRNLQGMDAVSGQIPVTVKLRMGNKDDHPVVKNLIGRIFNETNTSAATLHGRSRQQRYSKNANWDYIGEIASKVKSMNERIDELPEDSLRTQPLSLIGNGDCYSWQDWYDGVNKGVDTVMIARGALVKPWIFEEIEARQFIDKSSTQRLEMLEQYCNNGLEYWGSDSQGVNTTRRFFLEFMSFFHRYTPIALYEVQRPRLNDRPPLYTARDEMETLLASNKVTDWIKLSEFFLGPTPERFTFTPKHKSNSVEEAEG